MYDKILSTLETEFQKRNISLHSTEAVEQGVLELANIIVRENNPESYSPINGKYIGFSYYRLKASDVDAFLNLVH